MHHNLAFLKSTPSTPTLKKKKKDRNRDDFSFCFKAWTHSCLFLTKNSCSSFHNDLSQPEAKAELAWCFWCFGQRMSRWPEGSTNYVTPETAVSLWLICQSQNWSLDSPHLIQRLILIHKCSQRVRISPTLIIPCENIKSLRMKMLEKGLGAPNHKPVSLQFEGLVTCTDPKP